MAALPALEKTWYTQANVPFADISTETNVANSFWFNLKTILCGENTSGSLSTSTGTRPTGSYWTVVSSSDSVSASAGDLWGTTYNASKFVRASNNYPHSWIILQNTTLGHQMLIELNSTTENNARMYFTPISAPFSNCTVSTVPVTSQGWIARTTEVSYQSGDNNHVFISDKNANNGRHYTHVSFTEEGEFFALTSRVGQDKFNSFIGFVKTIDANPADTRNYVALTSATIDLRGCPALNLFDGNLYTDAGLTRRTINNSIMGRGGIQTIYKFGGTGADYFLNMSSDPLLQKYLTFPLYTACVAPQAYYSGRLPDMYYITQAANCSSIPSTSAQQRIVAGYFLMPMTDIVPYT